MVDKMKVCVESVREAGKIAEVCICYTEDILPSIKYDFNYYVSLTKEIMTLKPHFIAIKDMAGLLKVSGVGAILKAIRSVTDTPIHFHTHDTSSAQIATCLEMVKLGCEIVDVATSSLANTTSQPSMNALCAALEGSERDTGVSFMDLEGYDLLVKMVRTQYSQFENGQKSGTARVYHHEIPGGQVSRKCCVVDRSLTVVNSFAHFLFLFWFSRRAVLQSTLPSPNHGNGRLRIRKSNKHVRRRK